AFGCDRVFFVTNGTSTSNKMVEQALLAPGDIAIVDRNCHKSHHYGMVIAGAQPYYVEAYPMTAYSMYGGVPLRSLTKALLDIEAWLQTPAATEAFAAQEKSLGRELDPKDPRVLDTRLQPDPSKVRLRIYQTNSTHKSMSSLRQGSMVLVRDVDFHHVEAQFK